MNGREKSPLNSWIVSTTTDRSTKALRRGWPTGYDDTEIDPECLTQIQTRREDFDSVDPNSLMGWLDAVR